MAAVATFPKEPSHAIRNLSTRLHTPRFGMVISLARHRKSNSRLPGSESGRVGFTMPTTHREPLCLIDGVTIFSGPRHARSQSALPDLRRSYWLMRQTKTLLTTSVVPISTSLCRLLRAPAGRWPFPTLSLRSLHGRLGPYPATTEQCTCPFLPTRHRSPLRVKRIDS